MTNNQCPHPGASVSMPREPVIILRPDLIFLDHQAPMTSRTLGLLSLAAVLALAACSTSTTSPAPVRLVVAVQPTLAADEMLDKARPLEAWLEQALPGTDVQIYVPLSQAGVIEALRFGQAHVAFMGAWPAYLASRLGGAELALAEVREVLIDDEPVHETFYFSYWVVPHTSPAKTLIDLQGRRACFPSPISTSGYVAPLGRLVELGLVTRPDGGEADPAGFFSEVRFGGGYAQCWEALKGGQVDVTVIAGDVPATLYNDVLAATRVVERQGPIPSHAVLLSRELEGPLREQVVDALLRLGDEDHRPLMRQFVSGIFVGFERSDAETHLAQLRAYLDQGGLRFTERLAAP